MAEPSKAGVRGGREQLNGEAMKVDKSKEKEKASVGAWNKDLPKSTKCLMDCEAADILQGIQDHMVVLSSDPDIKIPISFDRGLTYAKREGDHTDSKAVRKTLAPLKKHGLSDFEICIIANMGVESVDEIFALLPTLKDKDGKTREAVKSALDKLTKLKSLR